MSGRPVAGKLCGCVLYDAFSRSSLLLDARGAERFYHGVRNGVDRGYGADAVLRIVVEENREDERFAAQRGGVAGKRANVLDLTRLRLDQAGGCRAGHAGLERAVSTGDGERRMKIGAPGLVGRIGEQRDHSARRDEIVAAETRTVREDDVAIRNSGSAQKFALHFESGGGRAYTEFFVADGAQQKLSVQIVAYFVREADRLEHWLGIVFGENRRTGLRRAGRDRRRPRENRLRR